MLSAGSVGNNNKTPLRHERLQKDKEEAARQSESEDSAGDQASNESEESTGDEVELDKSLSGEDIEDIDAYRIRTMPNYYYDNSNSPYDE
jgi:hypothetical protein